MDRSLGRPFLALLLVQVSFASLAVAGKMVLADLPSLVVAGIRLLAASVFLGVIGLVAARDRVSLADHGRLILLSLLGIVCNQLLFLEGLARTTAVNASILIATIPVFTTGLAVLLGRERARRSRILGISVAFLGTLVLLEAERASLAQAHVLGNVFVVLNCLSYSLYLVFSRPMLSRYRSTTVVAWTFLYGALIVAPLAAIRGARLEWGEVSSDAWLAMVWVVLVPSVLAYSLNNYALKRIQSSTVASFVFLQPVIGVLLAVLLLPAETLDLRAALSGALILAGVILVSRSERYEPVAAIPGSGEAMSRLPIEPPDGRTQPEPQEDHQRGRRPEAP